MGNRNRSVVAPVDEPRLIRMMRDRIALLGFTPGTPEAIAFEQGFRAAEEIIAEQTAADQPIIGDSTDASDEDKKLANEYGIAIGKHHDDRWASYRDYLRGLQRGRLIVQVNDILDSIDDGFGRSPGPPES